MIKFLSLFSGIGAFEKALKNLHAPYDLVAYSEIDKFASKSYAAIHGVSEDLNLGDITKINVKNLPNDIDLVTYGFPCQDISIAGKQAGMFDANGNQTRSGLFFDALRIIKETQPRIAIAENVKNLLGNKFKTTFNVILRALDEAGYNSYYSILNLKDYGIPQNRERVFIVSIRKDVDNHAFKFGGGRPLELRLIDMLEPFVDEKYYMSEKAQRYIVSTKTLQKKYAQIDGDIGLTQRAGQMVNWNGDFVSQQQQQIDEAYVRQIGNCCPTKTRDNPNQGRIYDVTGLCPTLNCMGGGNRQPCVIDDYRATAVAMRGRYDSSNQSEQHIEVSDREYANTITSVQKDSLVKVNANDNERIRKLTPKECFRLMGFDDQDWQLASAVVSDSQLYKQSGNSIGVPCLESIFSSLIQCGMIDTK